MRTEQRRPTTPRPRRGDRHDVTLAWLTREYGPHLEQWRALAAEWIQGQERGVWQALTAVSRFVDAYIHGLQLPTDPAVFLRRGQPLPSFYERVCPKSQQGIRVNNSIHRFLTWVLETRCSEEDAVGRRVVPPSYDNPVRLRDYRGVTKRTESVRSPLPYRYIEELRAILAPGRHFRDWTFAQQAIEYRFGYRSDWFRVEAGRLDKDDPDCVWRVKTIPKGTRTRRQGKVYRFPADTIVYEMWSPARTMVALTKLMLPARTYQVRMLDSGEADTFTYDGGGWRRNAGPLAEGTPRRPVQRGVFRRLEDRELGRVFTGIYVSTNKTADINREEGQKGYVIPWEYGELFYWLEKLRNWQANYNPLAQPVLWTELALKHVGHSSMKSAAQLQGMPPTCFLFRDAAARHAADRAKPITPQHLDSLWRKLLEALEQRCAARGETLSDGQPLRFVDPTSTRETLFPPHSLRVSLLTCYALEGEVDIVILSKLIAGHFHPRQTHYYVKPGVGRITQTMADATTRIKRGADALATRWLLERGWKEVEAEAAYNDWASLSAAVPANQPNRNPIGWEAQHIGLCVVGGNTAPIEGNVKGGPGGTIGGCYNGGPCVRAHTTQAGGRAYAPVPGGPKNCVRCRWFLTHLPYYDALEAHANNLLYKLCKARDAAYTWDETRERLKGERYQAERTGTVFAAQPALLDAERRYEAAMAAVNERAKDLLATERLLKRLVAVSQRSAGQQLVASGTMEDLRQGVVLEEFDSNLMQLVGVCIDAEVYPDEDPGTAPFELADLLNSAFMREGLAPAFLGEPVEEKIARMARVLKGMARHTDPPDPDRGLRRVVSLLEAERSLKEFGVLQTAVRILEDDPKGPVPRLRDFIVPTTAKKRPLTGGEA